jgi:hypothetical protein
MEYWKCGRALSAKTLQEQLVVLKTPPDRKIKEAVKGEGAMNSVNFRLDEGVGKVWSPVLCPRR